MYVAFFPKDMRFSELGTSMFAQYFLLTHISCSRLKSELSAAIVIDNSDEGVMSSIKIYCWCANSSVSNDSN